jgi:hypothetical protein
MSSCKLHLPRSTRRSCTSLSILTFSICFSLFGNSLSSFSIGFSLFSSLSSFTTHIPFLLFSFILGGLFALFLALGNGSKEAAPFKISPKHDTLFSVIKSALSSFVNSSS